MRRRNACGAEGNDWERRSPRLITSVLNSNQLSPTEIKNRDKIAAALSAVVMEWAAKRSKQIRAQAITRAIVCKRCDTAVVEARV
jgi:hypothetical protein